MVGLIKKVFPSSVKKKIKSINRERQLGVAVKRLTERRRVDRWSPRFLRNSSARGARTVIAPSVVI